MFSQTKGLDAKMECVCDSAHVEVSQAEQGQSGQQTNEDQRINVQAFSVWQTAEK